MSVTLTVGNSLFCAQHKQTYLAVVGSCKLFV